MGYLFFFFLMIRRPPRSTLFPYTNALPICRRVGARGGLVRRAALAAAVGGVARGGSVDQPPPAHRKDRSEEHTSELQSQSNLVCRLLLEKKNQERQSVLAHQCHRVHGCLAR